MSDLEKIGEMKAKGVKSYLEFEDDFRNEDHFGYVYESFCPSLFQELMVSP